MENRQGYNNVPFSEESSFFSQESVTSKTPLALSSPTRTSPDDFDEHRENPYETPIDFEESRVRHEQRIIAGRSAHRKKKSPLYEMSRINGVHQERCFDDEGGSEVHFVHHNDKKYKCLFIWLFILVVIALASSAAGIYVLLSEKVFSSQTTNPQKTSAKGSWFCLKRTCHREGVMSCGDFHVLAR